MFPLEKAIQSIHMPENLAIAQMVKKQREECQRVGCPFDYYALAFGQSPFQIPAPLQKALADNAASGGYAEAAGIERLRQAVASFHRRYFEQDVESEDVIIGPGTKTLLFMAFAVTEGTVVIPSPSWIGYSPFLKLLGKEYRSLPLHAENNYKISPQELDSLLKSLKSRSILVLNSPHNPTGAVYNKQELEDIAGVCRKYNTVVFADEIYALTTYHFDDFVSMANIYPEGTLVTSGLSKDRSAGGYRLGVCLLPRESTGKLREAFIKLAAVLYTSATTPVQLAAVSAYEENKEIDEYLAVTRNIHRIMGRTLHKAFSLEGLTATVPNGGFYFYLDFQQLSHRLRKKGIADSNALGRALLAHPYHFAVVTGDALELPPDRFGARVAFVDYDGESAYRQYLKAPPSSPSEEEEFFRKYAPRMAKSVEALQRFLESL
jgi:aspartate aminotransferase